MPDTATLTLETTEDTLLGGKVKLVQPRSGYRVAIDPVLLAASVEAAPGARILDVGAGCGAIGLCLVARLGDVFVQGVEVQPELATLAALNAQRNDWLDFMSTAQHDIESSHILPLLAERLQPDTYDHVVTNPPYLPANSANRPLDRIRALSTVESTADLEEWLRFSLNRLKPGGYLTMVHRADRLDEILGLLSRDAGEVVIFPLWPGEGRDAHRIIVRCRKGSDTPVRLAAGLLLHDGEEKYTAQAEAILRGGQALVL